MSSVGISGYPDLTPESCSVHNGSFHFRRCREHGISEGTYHRWKSKFGGMGVSDARRLKELEAENRRLKRLVADLSLDKQALQEVLDRKW